MQKSIVFACIFCIFLSAYADENLVSGPELKLTQDGPSRIIVNKPAEYIISVSNTGDLVAKDMVLVNFLPLELDYISAEPPCTTFYGKSPYSPFKDQPNEPAIVTWKLGDIQPKQPPIVVKVQVRASAMARCRSIAKLYTNAPEATNIQPLEVYCDIMIHGIHAMHISTYDTEDPVKVGKQTIYVIETRNEGTAPCTNIVVKSKLDDELEFVSAEGPSPYKVEGNVIIFDAVPILAPSEKLLYKVVYLALQKGCAKHTAILRYDQFESEIISQEGTTIYKESKDIAGYPAMHISTYDTEDPIEIGKQTIYVIEIRNEGTSPCTNIVMKSKLNEELEFISAKPSSKVEGNMVIFDTVPILLPREKLRYTVVCRALQQGSAKHAAILKYDQFDQEIISEEGTTIYR